MQDGTSGEPPGVAGPAGTDRPTAPGAEPVAPAGGAPTRGRGARRAVRVLSWISLVMSLVLLLGTATAYGVYRHYGSQIETLPQLVDLQPGGAQVGQDENYLVVGSDSADSLTAAELEEAGAYRSGRDGTRTDTLLLVQVPADGSGAQLVSFPRDSLVQIPGHGLDKINAAYDLGEEDTPGGGPAKVIETVEALSGLSVDHYVEVNLYGFVTMTDALGGVEVCLSEPAQDEDANIDLPAGEQRLDGRQALGFVRQRKGLAGGDLGRIRRQQYFLGAMTRQVLSAGTLLNPAKIVRLLDAVTGSLLTDPGTSKEDLLSLALQLREVSAKAVKFRTIPITNPYGRYKTASVVLLDTAALPAFFADLGADRAATPALKVAPASITLQVENGSSTGGLGTRAAGELRDLDFTISAVRDADRHDVEVTQVRYGSDRRDSARTVAAALPGSVLVNDPTLGSTDLVVTVGKGYAGVSPVTVSGPKNPDAVAAAKTSTAADAGCIA